MNQIHIDTPANTASDDKPFKISRRGFLGTVAGALVLGVTVPGAIRPALAQAAATARDDMAADLVLFPELSLTGYPPEDLLLRPSLDLRVDEALARLREVRGITLVFGLPERARDGGLLNAAWAMRDGEVLVRYAKHELPNSQVFDERRYFVPGERPSVFEQQGVRIGLTICEDIWFAEPIAQCVAAGARLVLDGTLASLQPGHESNAGRAFQLLRETQPGSPRRSLVIRRQAGRHLDPRA